MNIKECKKFANVAVNVGVNLQKGQDALIFVSAKNYKLAQEIVKECYKKGARKVTVEFTDEEITKLKYKYEEKEVLSKMPKWERMKFKERSEICPCLIYIDDDDPDAFNKLDAEKIFESKIARSKKVKKYRDQEMLYDQWTILAIPSTNWAKKVFPNDNSRVAKKKLLKAIMHTTRLDNDNPLQEWENHIALLDEKAKKLNDLNLNYLVYTSSNGTNLKLYLQENHIWLSARSKSLKGIPYCANLPTEEVFTMPKKDGVDGVVVSTKPLSYNGKVVENFKLYFEKGRIVKVEAEKNEDVLKKAINTDEGSHYLGEVALVPYSSPINETGILFFNTLFDENASCHLAFGEAYKETLKDYDKMQEEDYKKINYNESLIHVDFMIGAKDLQIIGYDFSNKPFVIFKDGNWAI